MTRPLKDLLREHYGRETLSREQVHRLRTIARSTPYPRTRRRLLLACAAVLVASIATAGILRLWSAGEADWQYRLAEEIAMNHLAGSPLDVTGDSIEGLRPAFTSLGFSLIESPAITRIGWRVEGGRYCSLQAVPAALLRYRSADNTVITVYQAPYDRSRHGPLPERDGSPLAMTVRGVHVTAWVEDGILMATASSPDMASGSGNKR